MYSFAAPAPDFSAQVISYVFSLLPTQVCVPVVANPIVSPFTRPSSFPSAVSDDLSYGLLAFGVVTVSGAGVIVMLPSTYLIFSLEVTSSPFAFSITSVSLVAATAVFVTSFAVALDAAALSV